MWTFSRENQAWGTRQREQRQRRVRNKCEYYCSLSRNGIMMSRFPVNDGNEGRNIERVKTRRNDWLIWFFRMCAIGRRCSNCFLRWNYFLILRNNILSKNWNKMERMKLSTTTFMSTIPSCKIYVMRFKSSSKSIHMKWQVIVRARWSRKEIQVPRFVLRSTARNLDIQRCRHANWWAHFMLLFTEKISFYLFNFILYFTYLTYQSG